MKTSPFLFVLTLLGTMVEESVAGTWSSLMASGQEEAAKEYAKKRLARFQGKKLDGINTYFILNRCRGVLNLPHEMVEDIATRFDVLRALKRSLWAERVFRDPPALRDLNASLSAQDVDRVLKKSSLAEIQPHMGRIFSWFLGRQEVFHLRSRLCALLSVDPKLHSFLRTRWDMEGLHWRLSQIFLRHQQFLAACVHYDARLSTFYGQGVELLYCDDEFNFDSVPLRVYGPDPQQGDPHLQKPGHGELMVSMAINPACCGRWLAKSGVAERFGFAPKANLSCVDMQALEEIPERKAIKGPILPRVINLSMVYLTFGSDLLSFDHDIFYVHHDVSDDLLINLRNALQGAQDFVKGSYYALSPKQLGQLKQHDIKKLYHSRKVLKRKADAKTVFVKAAGNRAIMLEDGEKSPRDITRFRTPHLRRQTLIVGCYDLYNQTMAPYSNTAGQMADRFVLAPGHWNFLARPDGTFATNKEGGGTSLATALVSALVADLYAHFPEFDAVTICEAVLASASKDIPNYQQFRHGQGLIDYQAAFKSLRLMKAQDPLTNPIAQ
ncbi:MAG: S8 family serine peptidase [Holosporales bacterium]